MRLTITVRGCSVAAVPGASVHLIGPGGFDQTNITDASGVVAFDLTDTGTYSYSVSKTGYATKTGSTTLGVCADKSITVQLTVPSGYSCLPDSCCPQGGSAPYPILSYPSTITLNDGFGDITLTRIGGTTSTHYQGSATRTAALGYACATDPTGADWPLNASQSVPVYFDLQCNYLIVSCNDCVDPDGSGCLQAPLLSFIHSGGGSTTAYPSTLTDSSSTCYHGYDANNTGGGEFFSGFGTGTVSSCPDTFAGSATAYFKFTSGLGGTIVDKRAPWQVYGDSATFTWVQ